MTAVIPTLEKEKLVSNALSQAMSYQDYLELFRQHAEANSSTYPKESEAMANYTRLNWSRSKRISKTLQIPQDIRQSFEQYTDNHSWLVITESWCGDAAQTMPIMQGLIELANNTQLKVVLRDQHPELMDAFLFDGTRSIPVLIIVDNDSGEIVGSWGPRPGVVNTQVRQYKKEHGQLSAAFKKDLQQWYNRDKGITTMNDLRELIA